MATTLQQLGEHGQSVWLDFISRDLLTSGELQRLIAEDNVTGMTSNPTIFQKAIAEGSLYDDQIRDLIGAGIDDPNDVFTELAITDIQRAADILRPVHERTGGADGFVSLEVAPSLADDTDATVAMARTLWERVDRPNLMIKIPATPAGIPAIRRTLGDGRNVNITLIFALAMHDRVIEQYQSALEARLGAGQSLDIHSVASFFVSRVDTLVDKLLEAKLAADPGNALLEGLLGKAAIANAVLAYELFERRFNDDRFNRLRAAGAHVQRPLWASTSAKNPNYRDVVYAEALIGPDTVDTMPPATIDAFRDHGIIAGDTVSSDYAGAHAVMAQLAEAGIDMDAVTQELLEAGVKQFADSYNALIRGIAEKIELDDVRVLRTSAHRRRQSRCRAARHPRSDRGRHAHLASRPRSVEARRHGTRRRDPQPARLARRRLGDARAAARAHRAERRGARSRMAGLRAARDGRLQPVPRGAAHLIRERHRAPDTPRPRHHRPARDRAGHRRDRPRKDRVHRLEQIRHHPGDAVASRAFLGGDHRRRDR